MGKLDGKVAVITGGTTGMALAGARLFVDEGAHVFVQGRRQDVLDEAGLDQWLVLRGGIRMEQFWVEWITEYLDAHEGFAARSARTSTTERD